MVLRAIDGIIIIGAARGTQFAFQPPRSEQCTVLLIGGSGKRRLLPSRAAAMYVAATRSLSVVRLHFIRLLLASSPCAPNNAHSDTQGYEGLLQRCMSKAANL